MNEPIYRKYVEIEKTRRRKWAIRLIDPNLNKVVTLSTEDSYEEATEKAKKFTKARPDWNLEL